MKNKLLTIVVPVYNTEQYLAKCLDSLIVEDFMSLLEILIVIDGSPDNSVTIARRYAEKYPKTFIVIDKENAGYGSAVNKGLELATGKYFRLLDSDDWFDKEAFKKFLQKIENLDVDLVMTDYVMEYVFENRTELKGLSLEKNKTLYFQNVKIQSISNFLAMHRTTIRTAILNKIKLRLPEKIFYTDVLYSNLPFLEVNNFIYYDFPLYRYFIGREGQSMSLPNLFRNKKHLKIVFITLYKNYCLYKDNLPLNKKLYFVNFLKEYNEYILGILLKQPYKTAKKDINEWVDYIRKEIDDVEILSSYKYRIFSLSPIFLLKFFLKTKTIINDYKKK